MSRRLIVMLILVAVMIFATSGVTYAKPELIRPHHRHGPRGPAGPIGPIGPIGTSGIDGIDGIAGVDGIDGEDGIDGDAHKPRFEVGLGADLIVQERTEEQNNVVPLKTIIETKYDFANENGSAYLVSTYRVSEVFKGIKDLFGIGK